MPTHFLHIGKTGGTAVRRALSPFLETHDIAVHSHFFYVRDVPEGEPFFMFLRHPVPRFVSGFHSRQRQGRPLNSMPWTEGEQEAFSIFKTPNELAEALSSSDSVRRSSAESAMSRIAHVNMSFYWWIESDEYFSRRQDDLLMVGFQEHLDRDFEILKEKLQVPADAELPSDDLSMHRTPEGFDKRLSPAAVRNLSTWYARDIAFYERCLERHAV